MKSFVFPSVLLLLFTVQTAIAQSSSPAGSLATNAKFKYQITMPPGWTSQPLAMYDVLPDADLMRTKGFEVATRVAPDDAQNGLQLYNQADPNLQLFVFAHRKPDQTRQQLQDNVTAIQQMSGNSAPPTVRDVPLGTLPGHEVTSAAMGLKFVTVYAFKKGIRYGVSATYPPDKFASLQQAFDQVVASFRLQP